MGKARSVHRRLVEYVGGAVRLLFGIHVGIQVQAKAYAQLGPVFGAVLRIHERDHPVALLDGRQKEIVVLVGVRRFVAVNEPGRRRHDVQHAVDKRRPQVVLVLHDRQGIRRAEIAPPVGQEPVRQHHDIRKLAEHAAEYLPGTTPDKFAQLRIGKLVFMALELFGALVVFVVYAEPFHPSRLREPRDRLHGSGHFAPVGVVGPVDMVGRRMEALEERMAESLPRGQFAVDRHLRREVLPLQEIVMHDGRDLRAGGVRAKKIEPHAVDPRRFEQIGVRQDERGILIDVEFPSERDKLLPGRARRFERLGRCGERRRQKQRLNGFPANAFHFKPFSKTQCQVS